MIKKPIWKNMFNLLLKRTYDEILIDPPFKEQLLNLVFIEEEKILFYQENG